MLKICFIGLQRIIVNEWPVAFCIRSIKSVKLCQCYSLYHCESLGTAVFKVFFSILFVKPMKKFPSGIAQIKEGSIIFKNEKPFIFRDLQLSMVQIG